MTKSDENAEVRAGSPCASCEMVLVPPKCPLTSSLGSRGVCLSAGRPRKQKKEEEEEEEQEEGVRFTEGRPVGRRTTTKQIDARVYEKE